MDEAAYSQDWNKLSNQAIANELGGILRQIRLKQNFSQEQLGLQAGLSRSAISEMENGTAATSLLTIIQVLRALEHLQLLDSWQDARQINETNTLKQAGKKRARSKQARKITRKEENEWEWL